MEGGKIVYFQMRKIRTECFVSGQLSPNQKVMI